MKTYMFHHLLPRIFQYQNRNFQPNRVTLQKLPPYFSFSHSTLFFPSVLSSPQHTFTRRTSEHCLGTFVAKNFLLSSVKCSVSHYSPYNFFSFTHFSGFLARSDLSRLYHCFLLLQFLTLMLYYIKICLCFNSVSPSLSLHTFLSLSLSL
jgi:hypothetical protein